MSLSEALRNAPRLSQSLSASSFLYVRPALVKAHFLHARKRWMTTTGDKTDRAVPGALPKADDLLRWESGLVGEAAARRRLARTVDLLMSRWCARGAHKPLQILLRAYPGPLWHAYHRMELLECLETLNGDKDDLLPDERSMLTDALELLRSRIGARSKTSVEPGIRPTCG